MIIALACAKCRKVWKGRYKSSPGCFKLYLMGHSGQSSDQNAERSAAGKDQVQEMSLGKVYIGYRTPENVLC